MTQRQVSVRKKKLDMESRILNEDQDGLTIKPISKQGRGVVATRVFPANDLVTSYVGELISGDDILTREKKYANDKGKSSYLFHFTHRSKQYCIDATNSRHPGRMINHSVKGNLKAKVVEVQGIPYLGFFANRDIFVGDELTYNYAEQRSQIFKDHPWLIDGNQPKVSLEPLKMIKKPTKDSTTTVSLKDQSKETANETTQSSEFEEYKSVDVSIYSIDTSKNRNDLKSSLISASDKGDEHEVLPHETSVSYKDFKTPVACSSPYEDLIKDTLNSRSQQLALTKLESDVLTRPEIHDHSVVTSPTNDLKPRNGSPIPHKSKNGKRSEIQSVKPFSTIDASKTPIDKSLELALDEGHLKEKDQSAVRSSTNVFKNRNGVPTHLKSNNGKRSEVQSVKTISTLGASKTPIDESLGCGLDKGHLKAKYQSVETPPNILASKPEESFLTELQSVDNKHSDGMEAGNMSVESPLDDSLMLFSTSDGIKSQVQSSKASKDVHERKTDKQFSLVATVSDPLDDNLKQSNVGIKAGDALIQHSYTDTSKDLQATESDRSVSPAAALKAPARYHLELESNEESEAKIRSTKTSLKTVALNSEEKESTKSAGSGKLRLNTAPASKLKSNFQKKTAISGNQNKASSKNKISSKSRKGNSSDRESSDENEGDFQAIEVLAKRPGLRDLKVRKPVPENEIGDSEEESVTSGSNYEVSANESSETSDGESSEEADEDSIDNSKTGINEEKLVVECANGKEVMPAKNTEESNDGKKKIETKQDFCFYCKTMQTKLVRHILQKHKNEDDVRELRSLPAKSKARTQFIAKLRGKGNFLHNTQAEYNTGKLIVARRPKSSGKAEKYTACTTCHQFYSKSNIRHHVKKCAGKTINGREHVIKSKKLQARCHNSASKNVKTKLLPIMRDDDIYRIIRFDPLLIAYANKQCKKYKHIYQYDMVRSRLRYMGKILKICMEENPQVNEFSDLITPKMYGAVTNACNTIAGYDEDKTEYTSPPVALNLGTTLKKVVEVYKTECIIQENKEKQEKAEQFLHVFTTEYAVDVNKVATEQMQQKSRQKKVVLPSVKDITKLWLFLKQNRTAAFEKLKNKYTFKTWKDLMELTLISIQIFNRRRAGETERILIQDFEARQSIDSNVDPEVFETLSSREKQYAEKYVRLVVRGKLQRTVPVILQKDVEECCLEIIKYRKEAGVPKDNNYIFGLPSYDHTRPKFLRATGLLRRYSEDCKADMPYTLRGTHLRKHVATMCLKMNLNEQFSSDLAEYMGHSDKIHKDHYRMPVAHKQILGITKLLEIAQGDEEENASDVDDQEADNSQSETLEESNCDKPGSSGPSTSKVQNRVRNPGNRVLRPWSDKEKSILEESFEDLYKSETRLPGYQEIRNVRDKNICLASRTDAQIKTQLCNMRKRKLETGNGPAKKKCKPKTKKRSSED